MDDATRTALRASIAHWEENAKAESFAMASISGSDCALCDRFWVGGDCDGCPVKKHTGRTRCKGTPYYAALDAEEAADLPAFHAAAEAEVAFLRSLLP